MVDELPDEADELYTVEPEGFVAARTELAKRLRAEKRRDDADAVAKLRRPTPAAWALNQVARTSGDLVAAALKAGAALRKATESAVGGDASRLRAASTEERAATDALVDAAAERLGGRGPAARAALAATVRAAVLDEDVADELQRGVLTADHDEPGFGFGFGIDEGTAAGRVPKPKAGKPAARRTVTGESAAERRQRERAEAAERKAAEAAERDERRRRAAAEAEVDKLDKRSRRLAEVAERAEADSREARAASDAAAEEAAAARRALDGR